MHLGSQQLVLKLSSLEIPFHQDHHNHDDHHDHYDYEHDDDDHIDHYDYDHNDDDTPGEET